MNKTLDYETLAFKSQKDFRDWLSKNASVKNGLWVRIYKKASGVDTVSYAEALDEALCFGWIDGLKRSFDDLSYIQKFTPRRTKSIWSKRNIEHIDRLTKANLMTEQGMREVQRAKDDGRWQAAYDSPSNMAIPKYFLEELQKNQKAYEFFKTLNKTNTYAIAWRLQTAKTDKTKMARTETIIRMLDMGQKFH